MYSACKCLLVGHALEVVIAEINGATGEATAREIRQSKKEATFVPTDVAEESHVRRMVDTAVERYGRINILVNNAAILLDGQDTCAQELSNEVWERTLAARFLLNGRPEDNETETNQLSKDSFLPGLPQSAALRCWARRPKHRVVLCGGRCAWANFWDCETIDSGPRTHRHTSTRDLPDEG